MTVSISTNDEELLRLQKRIDAVMEIAKRPQLLLADVAKGIIAQTVMRIEVEKESPEGRPWKEWSAGYAATRDPGDSLLVDTRELVGSFEYKIGKAGFSVFTDLDYAGVHQTGGGNSIPARPYLGISEDNAKNIGEYLESVLLNAVASTPVKQTTRKRGKRK